MSVDCDKMVSVVIPTYNSAKTIGPAIDSVLLQDVALEILLIDDGSKDDLAGALSPYTRDPRIRVLFNEKNQGVAYTRNRGVAEARGNYVAFLDADDWWEAGKLAAQLDAMERTGAVLSCTARELMNSDGTSRGRIISVQPEITYEKLLRGNTINCSSVVLRTDVAREFPMECDEAHEDYIMWLKVLKKYKRAVGIDHPYLKYRMSENSKSGTKLHSAKMTYMVYRHMGYGHLKCMALFASYAVNGVLKYYF